MPGPLMVCDAPSVLFRAYHALPSSITGVDGRPVGALLGGANLILSEVERHGPRAIVACFGAEAATYRVKAYPGYHAERDEELPADLAWQWEQAPRLLQALGVHVADHDELEADDLLGSYAAVEEDAGGTALLLTGDRDLWQCATDRVSILYLRTGGGPGAEVVGPAEVGERYGVPPALVPDFIALRGDPSDGLPGARGIGPKTAARLLERHGSLAAVLARASDESPRIAAALTGQADELATFLDIATLRRIEVSRPEDREVDRDAGARVARELGMERLAERLTGDARAG